MLNHQIFTDERRSAQESHKFGAGARRFGGRHGRKGLAYPTGLVTARAKNGGHSLYESGVVCRHGDLDPPQSLGDGPYTVPNDPSFRSFMFRLHGHK